MAFSKITLNGTTLMDVTQDTVTASTLLSGEYATKADGVRVQGTLVPGGDEPEPQYGVTFIDYDGTELYNYTVQEAHNLSALPSAPSHTGLSFEEWNYTLEEVKSADDGLIVGPNYVTSDGKTKLYLTFLSSSDIDINLAIYLNSGASGSIDWGDGTSEQFPSGTGNKQIPHTYTDGNYPYSVVINIDGTGWELGFSTSLGILWGTSENITTKALRKVELGNGIEWINANSFYNCPNLESISITSNCLHFAGTGSNSAWGGGGSGYTKGCFNNLKAVVLSRRCRLNSNKNNEYIANTMIEIISGINKIGNYAFTRCFQLKKIYIPNNVTAISTYSFNGCGIEHCTIPNSVTAIYNYAFESCYNLKSVKISNQLTTLGNYAFRYCFNLKSITLPNTLTSIGGDAFEYCYNLESITFPNTLTTIGAYAFRYCSNLKSITLPSTLTTINTYAFAYCYSLKSITFPSAVTSIDTYAFSSCWSLESITFLGNNITSIGNYVFAYCSQLNNIVFPNNSITNIGNCAFQNCYSLTSINLPNSLLTIGNNAFDGCSKLNSIIIPSSVTDIGANAFTNIYSLDIYMKPTTPPTLASSSVFVSSTAIKIYVPYSSDHSILSAYQTATNWASLSSKMVEMDPT